MIRIGLLSDTHGFFDERINEYFGTCHEIWHAGDIGDLEIIWKLKRIASVVAVYGNIDGGTIRASFPAHQRQVREGEGEGTRREGRACTGEEWGLRQEMHEHPPGLFISGHSHILKVMPDKRLGLLHMNPGAAGRHGLHKVRTLLRFEVDGGQVGQVDVIELGPRSQGTIA